MVTEEGGQANPTASGQDGRVQAAEWNLVHSVGDWVDTPLWGVEEIGQAAWEKRLPRFSSSDIEGNPR